MNRRHILLISILLAFASALISSEIRSLWVLPWSINTPAKIDEMISKAVQTNQTEIMIEIRYRSDALYKTNRLPDPYDNPEPQSYIMNGLDFDPLDYAITAGHKAGLKVQAWMVVFNATPIDANLMKSNYMVREHPDWITYDSDYLRMRSTEQFGYFVDPGIPAVREHLLNVFGDVVSGYPELDGIHMDYIRYPNTNFGYHPISRGRFQHDKNQEPSLEWNEWRIRQISSFVEQVYRQSKSINPKLTISAAVFADQFEAVSQYAQNWQDWLDKGFIDRVYLMHYHKVDRSFIRILENVRDMGHNDRIVIGLRAWENNNGSLLPNPFSESSDYSVYNLIDRINWVRDFGFAGVALFSFDGIIKGGALDYLGRQVFADTVAASTTETPPAEDSLCNVHGKQETLAPDVVILPNLDSYQIHYFIPVEGNWKITLFDEKDNKLMETTRYFPAGPNTDTWNGQTSSGSRIDTGVYYFRMGRDMDNCDYLIPVEISRIW